MKKIQGEWVKNRIILLAGPGGVGKNTILDLLLKNPNLNLKTVSKYTTRAPRESEMDGGEFHFVSETEFLRHQSQGDFIESNYFNGHYYGTPRQPIDQLIPKGISPILVVDVHGVTSIKQAYPNQTLTVFITAPEDDLCQRLKERGSSEEYIEERLRIAREVEIPAAKNFDLIVENCQGQPNETVSKIANFILNSQNPTGGTR